MRCAVIDMGTNTFHLMIVEKEINGNWTPLVRHRVFVKLAEDGLRRIGEKAFERGIKAMKTFKMQIDAAEVPAKNIKAFGTAALRSAQNGRDFVEKVQLQLGIRAEIIPGKLEAELIYCGTRRAVPFPAGNVLVMDIGGGSVELIIANAKRMLWCGSFDVGVSVLYQNFHRTEPIANTEVLAIEDFLDVSLKEFWQALEQFPVKTLVGASGAFDVIDNFLLDLNSKPPLYGYTHVRNFDNLYQHLTSKTYEERREMPQLSPERTEMIVVAMVLIRYIIRRAGIFEIYTSEYAMKEGILEKYF